MKKIVLLSIACAAISLVSCRKTRSCTCTGTTTDVNTVTNSSGAVVSSNTTTTPEEYTDVITDIKSSEISAHRDCMSRIKKSSNTYASGSNTVNDDYTTDLNCTIK